MHVSCAIFNVSMLFRCDRKFGKFGRTKHSPSPNLQSIKSSLFKVSNTGPLLCQLTTVVRAWDRKSYPSSNRFVVHISSSVGDSCYGYNYIRDSAARGRQAYTYTQQHALGAGGNDGISTCHDPKRERTGSLTDSQTSIDVFFSTIDLIKHPFES